MNLSALIKKTFTKACVYFSLITAIYALLVMITNVDDELVLIDAGRVLMYFVASILFAIGNAVFSFNKLGGPIKVFIHYLIYLFTFATCFMLPISPESSTMIVGITLFTIAYAVVLTIVLVVKARYKTREEKQQTYRSQFKK